MTTSPIRRRAALASLVPTAALLAAFTTPRVHAPRPSHVLTITAREFAFVAPDTVPAGLTTIRLLNRGVELHHVELVRLDGGHRIRDFFAALSAGGPPPAWAHMVGGPNAPVPGAESTASLELAPGRYALICMVPSPDGTPHVMKGMAKEIVAIGSDRGKVVQAGGALPTATMTLTDYHFALSAPLRAGTTVLRVKNEAAQPHEVLFVKLAPGHTAQDMVAWVDRQAGPPPGAPIGGTTGMDRGMWNDVTLSLTPGEYALLCFLPDAHDGKPHVAHGMATQFTVR